MASTYSTNLGIELPGTGDQAGVWGNTTNTNLGTLIEQAISGYVTQAVATGTDTTITIPNGATGVARNMYLELTGTGGASTNLIVPANKKLYFIFNNTSSGQVTVKVAGQTGISVPNGKKMILVSNGTDIVTAENYVASLSSDNLTLTGTLAVGSTSTFTGAATFTANPTLSAGIANGVVYLNASKVATSGSALVFDGTNLTLGGSGSGSRLVVRGTGTTSATFSIEAATSGGATRFLVADDGLCRWYGTSNAETMRLDNAGNLGIGTASPASKLEVTGDITQTWAASMDRFVGSKFSTTYELGLHFIESTRETRIVSKAADSTGLISFYTGVTPTQRAVIDSSGNLGIGTASPSAKLEVRSANSDTIADLIWAQQYNAAGTDRALFTLQADAANNLINLRSTGTNAGGFTFISGADEVMRLSSSGNLTVGPTGVTGADGISVASGKNFSFGEGSGASYSNIFRQANSAATIVANGYKYSSTANGFASSISSSWAKAAIAVGYGGAGGIGFYTDTATTVANGTDVTPTPRVVLDNAGNFGIGTVSPVYKLETIVGAGSGNIVRLGQSGVSNGYTITTNGTNLTHTWDVGGASMLLDTSGNLGIGTTSPGSVGVSGYTRLVLGSGSSATDGLTIVPSGTGGVQFTDAANVKKGYLQWDSSTGALALGTGGTTKATLDSSGNLGIGTTTINYRAVADCNNAGNNDNGFAVRNTNSSAYGGSYNFEHPVTGGGSAVRASYISSEGGGGGGNSFMRFATTVSGTLAERMRISSAGNVGIGTISPVYPLVVSAGGAQGLEFDATAISSAPLIQAYNRSGAAYIQLTYSALQHVWQTSGTERGRFTSGGFFKASNDGTYVSSTGSYHELRTNGSAGEWIARFGSTTSTAANCFGIYTKYENAAPNGTGNQFLICEDNAVTRAVIRSNGGLANYQANDVNLSDERVKTDIAPLGSMWAKIKALEIVTFRYKDQTHDDDNIGLIAQQVEAVAPEFVDTDGWGETPEDGVPLKSIYTADMYHGAIKALQEAMARIESLEAKVSALEAQ